MKSKLLTVVFIALLCNSSIAQNFSSYYKEGLYKFDDGIKILKSQIFTNYSSSFGFSQNNQMVWEQEGPMDQEGGVSGKYVQYCNGYKVEGTHMNVISKYGVVLYVNGRSFPNLNVNVSNPVSEQSALSTALTYIGANKYAWEDARLEDGIKIGVDPQTGDSTIDSTLTYYPKGELVLARPWNDTNYDDTSKYALCWKFCVYPMRWETSIVDTSTDTTVVALDTITGYRLAENQVVYVNAKTNVVYTVDPNIRASTFVTQGIDETFYHGYQSVEAWRTTEFSGLIPHYKYYARDHHNVNVEDLNDPGVIWGRYTSTWEDKHTAPSSYWCFRKAWQYYSDMFGFTLGPNSYNGLTPNNEQKIYINATLPGSNDHRIFYQPFVGTSRDDYRIGKDAYNSWEAHHKSAAQLDIIGHEYTHAMLHGRTNFLSYGDPGAIAEGFCDYMGNYISTWMYPSRYMINWSNGFGYNSDLFTRSFYTPTSDFPYASYDYYPGSGTDVHQRSGILRKVFGLWEAGGVHYSIYTPPMGSLTSISSHMLLEDTWITMYWFTWGNMNYHELLNQFLAEYEMYHSKCSPKWQNVKTAWYAVGITSPQSCKRAHLYTDPVTWVKPYDHGSSSALGKVTYSVTPTDAQTVIINYNWLIPQTWHMTYLSPNDNSVIEIDNVNNDFNSHVVFCIVTYSDSTKDTLSAFHHFVDDNYEQRMSPSKPIDNSNVTVLSNVEIFPNPAKNQLTVKLSTNPSSNVDFRMFDLTGRQICSRTIRTQQTAISLPELPSGVYIVKIVSNGQEHVKRIIIQQ